MNKKAQHEMVGFALIIIMVAVIGMVFLSFSMKKGNDLRDSPVAENFIESVLHHTTECPKYASGPPYLQIKDLAKECAQGGECSTELTACDALNYSITPVLNNSFRVGEDLPLKGYSFLIKSGENSLFNSTKGNQTQNLRGASQELANDLNFQLILYY